MGNLLNKNIDQTYQGLINTSDEGVIGVTPKVLTDGAGNPLPVQVGTTSMVYSGTQDFSGATVTGITMPSLTVGGFTDVTQIDTGSNLTATEIAPGIVQLDAAGGGGGSTTATPVGGLILTGQKVWKSPSLITGLGSSAINAGSNSVYMLALYAEPGTIIDQLSWRTASTLGFKVAIYTSVLATDPAQGNTDQFLYPDSFVEIATIASAPNGIVEVTGLNYTLPATTDNTYFIAIIQSAFGAGCYFSTQSGYDKAFTWNSTSTPQPARTGALTYIAPSYAFLAAPRFANGLRNAQHYQIGYL